MAWNYCPHEAIAEFEKLPRQKQNVRYHLRMNRRSFRIHYTMFKIFLRPSWHSLYLSLSSTNLFRFSKNQELYSSSVLHDLWCLYLEERDRQRSMCLLQNASCTNLWALWVGLEKIGHLDTKEDETRNEMPNLMWRGGTSKFLENYQKVFSCYAKSKLRIIQPVSPWLCLALLASNNLPRASLFENENRILAVTCELRRI